MKRPTWRAPSFLFIFPAIGHDDFTFRKDATIALVFPWARWSALRSFRNTRNHWRVAVVAATIWHMGHFLPASIHRHYSPSRGARVCCTPISVTLARRTRIRLSFRGKLNGRRICAIHSVTASCAFPVVSHFPWKTPIPHRRNRRILNQKTNETRNSTETMRFSKEFGRLDSRRAREKERKISQTS